MTLTEQFSSRETEKQKAAAYDRMQRERELESVYQQGNGDAYAVGRRDGASELTALLEEAARMQEADPRMYDAPDIPAGYTQGTNSIQGAPVAPAQRMPDLRRTNETELPAPVGSEQQSALVAAMKGR